VRLVRIVLRNDAQWIPAEGIGELDVMRAGHFGNVAPRNIVWLRVEVNTTFSRLQPVSADRGSFPAKLFA